MHSGHLPRRNLQKLGFHAFLRDHWLNRFRNVVDLESQPIRHHRHRLRQAMMLDHARIHLRAELFRRHPSPDLLLQRQPPLRSIHHAHGPHGVHALRNRAQRQHQLVEHESRIHARSHQRHAFVFRRRIQLRCKVGMLAKRVRQLLARRNHAASSGETFQKLLHHAGEIRRSRVHHHVHRPLQHGARIRGNGNAPRRIRRSHHFPQVAPHLRRVPVDRAHDFERRLLPHQPRNRRPDRSHAKLHHPYLLHSRFLG